MATWKIGPTFADELVAAGLTLEGYSWDIMTGEINYAADMPQEIIDLIEAVYAVHDPAKQTDPPTPYPPGEGAMLPIQARPGPTPAATRWQIDRQLVIERLEAAHRFGAFMDALDDSNQLTRELWRARYRVWNDDPLVIALIYKASGDPLAILARP
jgi:hypothetical protein